MNSTHSARMIAPQGQKPTANGQGRKVPLAVAVVFDPRGGSVPHQENNLQLRFASHSELVVQTEGHTDFMTSTPGRGSRAAVVIEHCVCPVVAVRRHAAAAGADIVVRI